MKETRLDDESAPQSDSNTNTFAAASAPRPPSDAPETGETTGDRVSIVITVRHPLGLHLRIGKEVVMLASRFDAHLMAHNLTRASPNVDLRSILQLMQLQARPGHQLQLSAEGRDAAEAVEAVRALLEQSPAQHA